MMPVILSFDKAIFFFFQRLHSGWMDYFLAWPTRLGETIPAATVVMLGILIFDKTQKAEKIGVAAASIFASYWPIQYLKEFFGRPRPFLIWPETQVIFGKPYNSAFPSGHTAIVFAAAFALNYIYPKKMRWTYLIAAWVGITRIYTGVHYPTDVIAGALTGAACAALACKLLPISRKN